MKTLQGRTILVTRAADRAEALAAELRERGALVLEAPLIAFEDPPDWGPADRALARLESYDAILFTSATAVDRFFDRARRTGAGLAPLRTLEIRAIGEATARAVADASGRRVEGLPSDQRAEGLLDLLAAGGPPAGRRFLLPRAFVARETLPEGLRARGATVDVAPVYRTAPRPLPEDVRSMLLRGAIDMITLASGSSVDSLVAAMGGPGPLRAATLAAIGPVTAKALRHHGLEPAVVAVRSTATGLAESIAAHYAADHPTA